MHADSDAYEHFQIWARQCNYFVCCSDWDAGGAARTLSLGRLTQRLLVLKNLCLEMSSKAALSSSGHMALSRSISRPSASRRARWPPFLSAAVLSATCPPAPI